MKQLILDVLEDMSTGQINLASKVARETIANTIMVAIKTKGGWSLDLSTYNGRPKIDMPVYKKTDEEKVFPGVDAIQKQNLVDKLSEEIVDTDTGYIYESSDGGKAVYKRKFGSDKREKIDWKKIKKENKK